MILVGSACTSCRGGIRRVFRAGERLPGTALLVALLLLGFHSIPALGASVVISEFLAGNLRGIADEDGEHADWIEIANLSSNTVNLLNWSLTDDPANLNQWRFPGTNLAPGTRLVVFASNKNRRTPGHPLHTNFRLGSGGDFLALVRLDGAIEHAYTPAYPPQADDISYGLVDGSPSQMALPQGSSARARVPLSATEYDTQLVNWNSSLAFNDSSWQPITTGAGYDLNATFGSLIGVNGDLFSPMYNNNSSLFLRAKVVIQDPSSINGLRLLMKYDDGFAAWVNGRLVASNNCPANLAWNSAATANRDAAENDFWQVHYLDSEITNLVAGTNLLSIQGLNDSAVSTEMLLLPELEIWRNTAKSGSTTAYFTDPTPGLPNGTGATNLGPIITEATRDPAQRPAGNASSPPLKVTARITKTLHDVASVQLFYRIMFNAEIPLLMRDNGVAPDSLAGDGIYSVNVPTAAVGPGQMLRWRIVATDTNNISFRAPAWFAPVDNEQYYGTVALGADPPSNLPVLHWFLQSMAAADTRGGTNGSLFYLGRFYDNVLVSLHGQTTTGTAFKKKSHNVDFPRDNRFTWKEGQGKVKDVRLLTNYADKSKLRNQLAYEVYAGSGTGYCFAFPVRVHTNGAFYGIVDMMEDTDENYLERQGYDPDGAFYKIYDTLSSATTAEKKTRLYENNSDLQALISNLNTALPLAQRRLYGFDNINLPATVNYLASHTVVQNNDHGHKNFLMYRDSNGTREWSPMPWDVDLTFGHMWSGTYGYFWNDIVYTNLLQSGILNRLYLLVYNSPDLNAMFVRRVRTLMDTILKPPGTPAAQLPLENRISSLLPVLDPTPTHTPPTSDADMDFLTWGSWPAAAPGAMRDECNRILGLYLPGRRAFLYGTGAGRPLSGSLIIPAAQPASIAGLLLEQIDFNPISRNQAEEFFVIRNTNTVAVDLTGWRIAGAVDYTFPAGTVIVPPGITANGGSLYVAANPFAFRSRTNGPTGGQLRLVTGPYSGQLSARGETLRLEDPAGRIVATATYPGAPSLLQQYLRITEIMYAPDPEPGSSFLPDDFEFIELRNTSTDQALDLTGARFADGISFAFAPGTLLAPGQTIVVARNPDAFASRYGPRTNLTGPYDDFLSNSGERIVLLDAFNEEVLDFDYHGDWFPTTLGLGFSLVVQDESAAPEAWTARAQWRPSSQFHGSPGATDLPVVLQGPVINEVLAHTDLPHVDAIELFNPHTNALDISGWLLTDDPAVPRKYRIPDGTILQPGHYRVFDETHFNTPTNLPTSFRLSSMGDDVWLFAADAQTNLTGYYHGLSFGASANGVSFGRLLISQPSVLNPQPAPEEHVFPERALTLGTNNAGPLIGPIVVNSVMFHPPDLVSNGVPVDDPDMEFIELRNLADTNVALYDVAFPINHWRLSDAVEFVFPGNLLLPGGSRLLVVGFDPANSSKLAAFRAKWPSATNLTVLGPWSGKLDNSSDDIRLERPDHPNADGSVPYLLTDRVRYQHAAPWPLGADGTGAAICRSPADSYGDNHENWRVTHPVGSTPLDSDADGMPNWWEISEALDPLVADNAQDPDADGMTNFQEYLSRLKPLNPASFLRLKVALNSQSSPVISFEAQPDIGYTIERTPSLSPPTWTAWQQVPPSDTRRTITFTDTAVQGGACYRLVTPQN